MFSTFVMVFSLCGCTHTAPFQDGQGWILPGSIAAMETVSIGGIPQHAGQPMPLDTDESRMFFVASEANCRFLTCRTTTL
jgi:hypothetical protein